MTEGWRARVNLPRTTPVLSPRFPSFFFTAGRQVAFLLLNATAPLRSPPRQYLRAQESTMWLSVHPDVLPPFFLGLASACLERGFLFFFLQELKVPPFGKPFEVLFQKDFHRCGFFFLSVKTPFRFPLRLFCASHEASGLTQFLLADFHRNPGPWCGDAGIHVVSPPERDWSCPTFYSSRRGNPPSPVSLLFPDVLPLGCLFFPRSCTLFLFFSGPLGPLSFLCTISVHPGI